VDEGVKTTYYADADGDGYGSNTSTIQACSMPQGYLASGGDCNDNNASINPGANEACGNGLDDNCNGPIDEGCTIVIPSLTIDDLTINEAQTTIQLRVTLSAPAAGTVKVKYKTVNGTAVHPKDFQRTTGELVFNPGTTTQFVPIKMVSDNKAEPVEYFDVQLNTPEGATIADGSGRVTISEMLAMLTKSDETKTAMLENVFNIKVSSNPTNNYFMLQVQSSYQELVDIVVTDISGRLIETIRKQTPHKNISIGGAYHAGIYFAEVRQGINKRIVKLIKL
jgi:hypothetical protein